MPEKEQPHNNKECDRLAGFLRESIDRFMARLDIAERTSDAHEDRIHYEEWVRWCLVTSLVPDVLATACGVFDFDAIVLNHRMPDVLERALTAIPMDAAFIGDLMATLPDHERMKVVAQNLNPDRDSWTLADEVRHSFSNALCETLNIPEEPEEDCWGWWVPPGAWRSGVS